MSAEPFCCEIPAHRVREATLQAEITGDEVYKEFPRRGDIQPATPDLVQCLLNRSWRAALTVTGAEGFPTVKAAGNVLRPATSFKLSLRLPPRVEAKAAAAALKELIERDPPYGADVKLDIIGK